MRNIFFAFIITLNTFQAQGQLKDELMKKIIEINLLQDENYVMFPYHSDSERLIQEAVPNSHSNYLNFQALVKLISHDELILLTKHDNGVVRMLAVRQLIKQHEYNYDYFNFFIQELNKKDTIENQYADMIYSSLTYDILLQYWSGDWNYARSTGDKKSSKFLNKILMPIDSFILVTNINFNDAVYEDIFDRERFNDSMNSRIVKLIDSNLNFWAFSYLKKNNLPLFKTLERQTIQKVIANRSTLLESHPSFFEWFMRYMINNRDFKDARLMIGEIKKKEYAKEKLDYMFMGLNKKLVEKVLEPNKAKN